MELYTAVLILSGLIVFIGIPVNCVLSKGVNKKIVLITNGILLAVVLGVAVFSNINSYMIKKQTGADELIGGGLLSTLRYSDTAGEYYIIERSGLFYSRDLIAAPKGNIILSDSIQPHTNIIIAYKKNSSGDSWFSDDRITLGNTNYYYAYSVTGIYRDTSSEEFMIVFVDVIAAVLFNLIEIPVVITSRRHASEEEEKNDE